MTMDRTLPPPKEALFLTCSNEDCKELWQAYHGKVGCLCYKCDDKTPVSIRRKPIGKTD